MTESPEAGTAKKGRGEVAAAEEEMLEPQFGQDAQLDTMAALTFIRFIERRSLILTQPFFRPDWMLSLLDWIAFCLRGNGRDPVAVAFSCADHKITLYAAKNSATIDVDDNHNAEHFISMIRHAMQLHCPDARFTRLLEGSVCMAAHRMSRKIEAVIPASSGVDMGIVQRFDKIVDSWIKLGGKETSPGFLKLAGQFLVSNEALDGVATLKTVFRQFVTLATKPTNRRSVLDVDQDEQIVLVSTASDLASALVRSNFFRKVEDASTFRTRLDYVRELVLRNPWIQKIQQRLKRVATFSLVRRFSSAGLDYIAKSLGEDGQKTFIQSGNGISIVWLNKNSGVLSPKHGSKYVFSEQPFDQLRTWLIHYNKIATEEELDHRNLEGVSNIWSTSKEKSIQPFLHSEIQLIKYFSEHNIEVMGNFIGTSTKLCRSSTEYFRIVNWEREIKGLKPWVLSRTSDKVDNSWLIPDDSAGASVVRKINFWLESAIAFYDSAVRIRGDDDDIEFSMELGSAMMKYFTYSTLLA